jgi:membrane protein YdbS with pleckstrin-like domain
MASPYGGVDGGPDRLVRAGTLAPMALPRKFLNNDEELLAELRPHWIFLFGPLFTSIGVWIGLIVLVVLWQKAPGWTNYPILIIALIPGLWLLGRFVRWRSYVVALTSTRILVRQGILGRDTVQLRLQRITEVNIRQRLIERVLGTGSLIIDVQGEDDSLTLEYMRKPAVVQRVLNSQINEIVGGGRREAIPAEMQPRDRHGAPYADQDTDEHRSDDGRRDGGRRDDDRDDDAHDTPPFGVGGDVPAETPTSRAPAPAPPAAPAAPGTARFDIRDRLIELDDLRQRGILSEEEFAAKKSELLNRI